VPLGKLPGMDRQPQDIVVARPAAGVVQLTLRRPEFRNALRTQTLAEIAAELDAALADPATGAVVLTGGLDCFAAGADVREMAPLGPVDILTHERQRHWRAIATFAKPLVGAVCGFALGGGCELALCCDILVAGKNAKFGQPEVNLGMIPGAGGTQRLVRAVGAARARSMALRATTLDAQAAHDVGLVDEVCDPADVLATALRVAGEVARRDPAAIGAVKRAMQGGRAFREGLATEGAGFVSTASAPAAIARLRAFAAASDDRGLRTPWRDRSWLR